MIITLSPASNRYTMYMKQRIIIEGSFNVGEFNCLTEPSIVLLWNFFPVKFPNLKHVFLEFGWILEFFDFR